MAIQIRAFSDYNDAAVACVEAGFKYVTDSNVGQTSGRSFAPTITYQHPETGERVEVMWAHDRGAIRRLTA